MPIFPERKFDQAVTKLLSETASSNDTCPIGDPPTEFDRWLLGSSGEEFGLVHKLYEWYKLLHTDVIRYPKSERHAIGEVLKTRTLELIELVWEANALPLPERLNRLDQIQRTLDLIKLLVRLLYDIGVYKQDGYVYREQRLQEIGRMLGSWRKNTRKKLGLGP